MLSEQERYLMKKRPRLVGPTLDVLGMLLLLHVGWILMHAVFIALKGKIGILAYLLTIPATVVASPAVLALPWFEAWMTGEPVKTTTIVAWGSILGLLPLRILVEELSERIWLRRWRGRAEPGP